MCMNPTNMSTKETLPTMDADEIVRMLRAGYKTPRNIDLAAANLIESLRTRLDAAEKELVFHSHRCEESHNEGQAGMPQGSCQCLICAGFYNELTQLKERLSEVSKGTLMVENARLRLANAELVKDRERLDKLANLIWQTRWVSEDSDYQDLVGTAAEIRSGNFDGIDAAVTKGVV